MNHISWKWTINLKWKIKLKYSLLQGLHIKNENIEKIVKKSIETGSENENAWAAALGSVLSIIYQQLEQTIEEKLIAEKGKLEAEKNMEELLKTIQ